MEQFVPFITNHWILSALFGLTLVALVVSEFLQQRFGAASVTPEQAVQLINHQEGVVFDIRSESAFSEGHILGSIAIPAQPLLFEKKMGTLQKYCQKPIVVVCGMGQESSKMTPLLVQKGFLKVVALRGGIQSWKTAGLPLVQS